MRQSRAAIALSCWLTFFGLAQATQVAAQEVDVYSRPTQTERSRDTDVEHYRIELSLDENSRSFRGRTTVTLTSLRDDLAACVLDAETFVVINVEDGLARKLTFEHEEGRLTIHLAEPLSYGERVSLIVDYAAENVDPEGGGSDPGVNFQRRDDGTVVIAAHSWPQGARHWFPSYDHPNDRATQEVLATVREDYKVLSNGRLIGVTDGPAPHTRTWHWSQESPHCTYLFILVSGPYVVIEDPHGDLPISFWVFEDDLDNAGRSFEKTREMIDFFSSEFGTPYPWAKYDQIVVPGFGGGMENTTATVLGHRTIHDERAEQDFSSLGLVAHEAAHMWWGDLVSYRAWQETWISESFATYSEYLYTKHDRGDDEGAVNLLRKKESYFEEARNKYIRPIVFDRWERPNDNFDRHTYPKGAVVLQMLRWVLGDASFRQAITHFLSEHDFEAVDTHDLQKAIKEATGTNVDWFFEQWIYSPGHPVFDVSYEWSETDRKLRLKITQTQDDSKGVPVFTMPVVIGIESASGKSSERLRLSKREEIFEIAAEEPPFLVRFDEGNHLLKEWRFHKSIEELLFQLKHDDVIGRMWAASELAGRSNDERAIEGLTTAAAIDGFWGVRLAAVEAIAGAVPSQNAVLFESAVDDPNSEVRAAALKGLGETGNVELSDFFKSRYQADDSYLAQAEALRSLGRIGDSAASDLLLEAEETDSPRDTIRSAADRALEQLAGDPSS